MGSLVLTTLLGFNNTNGALPYGQLVQGVDGSFYGTTTAGGVEASPSNSGAGTIFRIRADGTLVWVVSLVGTGVDDPAYSGLIRAADGYFYGTSAYGGDSDNGTVFRLNSDGIVVKIYSFAGGSDGIYPNSGVIQGLDGALYGTTYYGGVYGMGTVFKVTTNGIHTVLHSFGAVQDGNGNPLDGSGPFAGLVQGPDGCFYGPTQFGGPYTVTRGTSTDTLGTIFKMSPNGSLTNLYSFTGGSDGASPSAGMTVGKDGFIYGTTFTGPNNGGTVFRITTNGQFSTIHTFSGFEGYAPNGVVQGGDGAFYGTTQQGGSGAYGTVFKMTRDGLLNVLYSFGSLGVSDFSSIDGALPCSTVIQATDGNLYGTTSSGGFPGVDLGTVFRLGVPQQPQLEFFRPSANQVGLTWTAVIGQTYQVQYSSDLRSTNWSSLGNPVIATNGAMFVSDIIASDTNKFYRITLAN